VKIVTILIFLFSTVVFDRVQNVRQRGLASFRHLATDTIHFKKANAPIIPLPFGPKINLRHIYKADLFYEKLIYPNSRSNWIPKASERSTMIYRLPGIKKLTCIGISSDDTATCSDGKPFANFLKLPGYRYRLPDIRNYQCYYWCAYQAPAYSPYSRLVQKNCDWCLINDWFGYLILYNPAMKEAHAIVIYFDTFRDGSDHTRYFYIDKNFNINLFDFEQEADDGDGSVSSTIIAAGHFRISINAKGEIITKKLDR